MNIDIDEAWQLWEDKFTAITKQKEFCPEQKKLSWVTAGTRHALRKHNFTYRKLAK